RLDPPANHDSPHQLSVVDLVPARGRPVPLDLPESLTEPEDILAAHPRPERHLVQGRRLPDHHEQTVPEALDLNGRKRHPTLADLERGAFSLQPGQHHVVLVASGGDEREDRGEVEATQHGPCPGSTKAAKAGLIPVFTPELI